jgi:hypothetical protein
MKIRTQITQIERILTDLKRHKVLKTYRARHKKTRKITLAGSFLIPNTFVLILFKH